MRSAHICRSFKRLSPSTDKRSVVHYMTEYKPGSLLVK